MVTLPHKMVGLKRMLDCYRDIRLQRYHHGYCFSIYGDTSVIHGITVV